MSLEPNCYDKVLTECVTWIVRVCIYGNDCKGFLDRHKDDRSISYHQIDFADTTNYHFHPLLRLLLITLVRLFLPMRLMAFQSLQMFKKNGWDWKFVVSAKSI